MVSFFISFSVNLITFPTFVFGFCGREKKDTQSGTLCLDSELVLVLRYTNNKQEIWKVLKITVPKMGESERFHGSRVRQHLTFNYILTVRFIVEEQWWTVNFIVEVLLRIIEEVFWRVLAVCLMTVKSEMIHRLTCWFHGKRAEVTQVFLSFTALQTLISLLIY